MAKIFISYRREDSQHAVDRLQDVMKPYLKNPKRDLFVDVDNIPIGVDFEAHLQTKISQCDAVLAVIGPGWLSARAPSGKPRLDSSDDFVRTEIAAALQRGIPVVPVLLDGTPMPRADQLPADIRGLVKRNGAQLDRKSFRADVDHIMSGLGFGQRKSAMPKVLVGLVSVAALAGIGLWGAQFLDFDPGSQRGDPGAAAIESDPILSSPITEVDRSSPAATEIFVDPARTEFVERLQVALTKLQYYNGAIDGIAGKNTNAAADLFAMDFGFRSMDIAFDDIAELEKMVVFAESEVLAANSTTGGFVVADRTVLIERYQKALIGLGYYNGPINGLPDDATHDATKAFSKDYNLTNLGLDFANLDAIERQVRRAEDLVANNSSGGFQLIDK